MSDTMYDELTLERTIRQLFGYDLEIRQLIIGNVPVSPTAEASLFLTNKKQLYLFVAARSRMTLGDVRKIVSRMGLKAELFVPPKGRPKYFDEVGQQKFRDVFPGRSTVTGDDLTYYRTLAPYNPALVQILEVRDGVINQFDSDSQAKWRPAVKFAYRRIKASY